MVVTPSVGTVRVPKLFRVEFCNYEPVCQVVIGREPRAGFSGPRHEPYKKKAPGRRRGLLLIRQDQLTG